MDPTLADKVRFLSRGAHLGEPQVRVERIETHFAWIFMTPRYVYKLRKPILQWGMNTLSVESRGAWAREELRINAELAPGVYLKVAPLKVDAHGGMCLSLDATQNRQTSTGDRTIDWVLQMRRLPAQGMFDHKLRERSWTSQELQALISHLCTFYARTATVRMSAADYCHRLADATRYNGREAAAVRAHGADVSKVSRIVGMLLRWIDAHGVLLAGRAERELIRDCHGDLKPEHICFGPPVSIIDRLEFDANLRLLDSLEDLCFLGLECTRLGAPSVVPQLLERYRADSGDDAPDSLAFFYIAQRALMRLRLAAWRLAEPDGRQALWRGRVAEYVGLAWDAACRASGYEP